MQAEDIPQEQQLTADGDPTAVTDGDTVQDVAKDAVQNVVGRTMTTQMTTRHNKVHHYSLRLRLVAV